MNTILKASLLASVAITAPFAGAATAQETMTLRFTHPFAATHWLWEEAGARFTRQVEEATDGRITFEVYPAAQIGRETAGMVAAGLADIGIVAPSYESDVLPLSSVMELPGILSSSCEGAAQLTHLTSPGGALYENEFKNLGVHVLYVNVVPPYSLLTASQKIDSLAGVAGLKIRANGNAMTMAVSALGGVPVPVTASEMYDALTRGTVDGILLSVGSIQNNHITEQVNYAVEPIRLGQAVTFGVIGLNQWESLDDETRQIMTQAGADTQSYLCNFLDQREGREQEELVSAGKLEIVQLSDEEVARWDEALKATAGQWVEDMEAAGLPGQEVLQALYDAPTE